MYHSVTFVEEPSTCSSSEPTKSDISASSNPRSIIPATGSVEIGVDSGTVFADSSKFIAAGIRRQGNVAKNLIPPPPPPYSSGDTDEDVDYAPDDEHPVPILRESAESKKEATNKFPTLDNHLL
ncbi:unnamed protein product [Adineta ricciae]|uniref:Uncharacterized protein n=1 Tax=Adineta ricciae TaxID=249248 RepID=A0A815S981_ADIRI|nr:unnamed protein product [Adineta ricciae]